MGVSNVVKTVRMGGVKTVRECVCVGGHKTVRVWGSS